jgi:hypothetical protein
MCGKCQPPVDGKPPEDFSPISLGGRKTLLEFFGPEAYCGHGPPYSPVEEAAMERERGEGERLRRGEPTVGESSERLDGVPLSARTKGGRPPWRACRDEDMWA